MSVQWEIDFDYEEFEHQLLDATLNTFTGVQKDREDEKFYIFSICTTLGFKFVSATANSQERLNQSLEVSHGLIQQNNSEIEISLDGLKTMNRYSSRYKVDHKYQALFANVNNMLIERTSLLDELRAHNKYLIEVEGVSELTAFLDLKVEHILLRVMSKLDELHIFEMTNKRENIVLTIVGVQDPNWEIRCARMLNPPHVFTKFVTDMKRGYEINKLFSQINISQTKSGDVPR